MKRLLKSKIMKNSMSLRLAIMIFIIKKNDLILLVFIEKIRLDVKDSNHFLLRNNSKIKVFLLLITKIYSIYLKILQNH